MSLNKEVKRALVRAGREDLVTAVKNTELSERAWDNIAGSWMKSQAEFFKVLQANKKDVMADSFMRKTYQKSIKNIETAMKKISQEIRDNWEAI